MEGFGEDRLKRMRDYLLLLARMQVGPHVRAKIDASDIVQQSLLEAHQNQGQFRGSSDAELMAWLRRILSHNLADAIKGLGRAKRNAALERPLHAALEQSSCRLEAFLHGRQSTPSRHAAKEESILCLVEALKQLPEAQRDAVELHHFRGLPLKELASQIGRSESAAAGLLHRGLEKLRELLQERGR